MNAFSRMTILAGLATLAALAAPGARAQSEIAPDTFDSPNTVPFAQPKARVASDVSTLRRDATFIAANNAQSAAKALSANVLVASLRSDDRQRPTASHRQQATSAAASVNKENRISTPE